MASQRCTPLSFGRRLAEPPPSAALDLLASLHSLPLRRLVEGLPSARPVEQRDAVERARVRPEIGDGAVLAGAVVVELLAARVCVRRPRGEMAGAVLTAMDPASQRKRQVYSGAPAWACSLLRRLCDSSSLTPRIRRVKPGLTLSVVPPVSGWAEIVILLGLARRTARKSRKYHYFTVVLSRGSAIGGPFRFPV